MRRTIPSSIIRYRKLPRVNDKIQKHLPLRFTDHSFGWLKSQKSIKFECFWQLTATADFSTCFILLTTMNRTSPSWLKKEPFNVKRKLKGLKVHNAEEKQQKQGLGIFNLGKSIQFECFRQLTATADTVIRPALFYYQQRTAFESPPPKYINEKNIKCRESWQATMQMSNSRNMDLEYSSCCCE